MIEESVVSSLITDEGENLTVQDWPLPQGMPLRGVVVLVHGLGEYAGRYEALARRFNGRGFAVRGYDQYGHGESVGLQGSLPHDKRLIDDLAWIIDTARAGVPRGVPLLLLGHSMGGLVAARLVALGLRKVDGLILSSPALAAHLNPVQRLLLAVLPHLAPDLRVANGVNPEHLSHDASVVRAYRTDPLVHSRISARLAQFITRTGPKVVAAAPHWTVPTLLLYAGADALVDPQGSRAFAAAAPPGVVQARCFESMYHEIFNETDSAEVYRALDDWIDLRCPRSGARP